MRKRTTFALFVILTLAALPLPGLPVTGTPAAVSSDGDLEGELPLPAPAQNRENRTGPGGPGNRLNRTHGRRNNTGRPDRLRGPRGWAFGRSINASGRRREHVPRGHAYGYYFGNRTRFYVNASVGVGLDVQVNETEVGNQEFGMNLDAPDGGDRNVSVHCHGQMRGIGLRPGYAFRHQNGSRFRFHGFVFNASANGTCWADLFLNVNGTPGATWMYYNETTGEWEVVPSAVNADGFLVGQVDHFSTFGVFILDPTGTDDAPDIGHPASWVGLFGGLVLAVLALTRKRRRTLRV